MCSLALCQSGGFIEVHLSTSVEVCEIRDRKGLYKKARSVISANMHRFFQRATFTRRACSRISRALTIRTKCRRKLKSPSTLVRSRPGRVALPDAIAIACRQDGCARRGGQHHSPPRTARLYRPQVMPAFTGTFFALCNVFTNIFFAQRHASTALEFVARDYVGGSQRLRDRASDPCIFLFWLSFVALCSSQARHSEVRLLPVDDSGWRARNERTFGVK